MILDDFCVRVQVSFGCGWQLIASDLIFEIDVGSGFILDVFGPAIATGLVTGNAV